MNYPKAKDCNTRLDNYERLVVEAAKGNLKLGDGYALALRVIEEIVYGNSKGRTPKWIFVAYLRSLLLKTRNWSLENWEEKTQDNLTKAISDSSWYKTDVVDELIKIHLGDIATLHVNDSVNGGTWENILDLDIDEEFKNKSVAYLTNPVNEV